MNRSIRGGTDNDCAPLLDLFISGSILSYSLCYMPARFTLSTVNNLEISGLATLKLVQIVV